MQLIDKNNLSGLDIEMRQMVLDSVAQLKDRLLKKDVVLNFDRLEEFPESIIKEMLSPEIGLQLLFIEEEYGGMGGGARDCCAVTKEMSKICLGICTAFFALQLGAEPIIMSGTEDQKEKWLGKIAQGDSIVAYAVTEPEAGSNLTALKTKAEPVKDDSGKTISYRINGSKQFISNGAYADFITLLAKTEEGPTFFIAEKGTPGFLHGKSEHKHGIKSSNTSPITFNDMILPCDNLVGKIPGQGLKQSNLVFGYTRLMVASMALGAGERAMELAVSYAKERIQFGSPLIEKQGYFHKLIAPNIVKLAAASAYIDEIAVLFDSGEQGLQTQGSIAKYFTSEAANKAADDAIQALGGYGYMVDYEVEKIKRDVKITCIYEGTSEIQQNIISTFRWKDCVKTKGDIYENIAKQMEEINSISSDINALAFAHCARILKEIIMLVHKNRLTKKQYYMFLLADLISFFEIGTALPRLFAESDLLNNNEIEKYKIITRLYSVDMCILFSDNIYKILSCKDLSEEVTNKFIEMNKINELKNNNIPVMENMDQLLNDFYR